MLFVVIIHPFHVNIHSCLEKCNTIIFYICWQGKCDGHFCLIKDIFVLVCKCQKGEIAYFLMWPQECGRNHRLPVILESPFLPYVSWTMTIITMYDFSMPCRYSSFSMPRKSTKKVGRKGAAESGKRKAKKVKDPNRPKRSMWVFFLWSSLNLHHFAVCGNC